MATAAKSTRSKQTNNGNLGGIKLLIATLSVLATIGGWAGFSFGSAQATTTPATTNTQVIAASNTSSTTNLPVVSLPSFSQSQAQPFTFTRSSR